MAATAALFSNISGLLRPGSIAVIGASDRPGNFGGGTVQNLLKFGYPGAIWPVHPRQRTVGGLPCFPSVRDLPGRADLAIFAIPGDGLAEAIAECAAAGILHGIAFAGGFAEAGDAGVDHQRDLSKVCRRTGFKLCGPNCVGIINTEIPVTATFATALKEVEELRPGRISMISQSGGLATATMATAHKAGFGFRYLISSGNEAVLSFADYLHALVLDEGTGVIVGYLEGVADGGRLLRALEEAREQRKPVILIKAGTTRASAHAAQAHTGALAGEDRVYDAVFREMAVIRVYSIEELLDVALMLSGADADKLPNGPGVGIVTFGGGNGVLAADQCAQSGLSTPPLSPASVERLKRLLVPVASASNPMDLTPQTAFQPERLARLPEALDILAAEPEIQALCFIVSSLAARAEEICEVLSRYWEHAPKTVCVNWPDAPRGAPERLAGKGIYVFPEHARGVRALGRLVQYGARLSRPRRPAEVELPSFDWSAFVPEPRPHTVLPEHECQRLLAAGGLRVAAAEVASSPRDAVAMAERIGFPVVLKGLSRAVTHRAAADLLAVDLRTADEVAAAYGELADRAKELKAALDGIYVQRMVRGGLELLVSAFRDPLFGTMLTCGAGGNFTEAVDDVAIERAPVDAALGLDILGRLRLLRRGPRLFGDLDPSAPAEFLARFSRLAATAPWQRFVLEVNPIKWTRDGVVAVDALLIVEQP